LLSEMINEGSKLRPLGSKQGFPVKGGTQCLVGSAHLLSMDVSVRVHDFSTSSR
jgi:hypothetical protein